MTDISPLTGLPMPLPMIMDMSTDMPPLPLSYEQFKDAHPEVIVEETPVEKEDHKLSWPQYQFVTSEAKFPAMVAGYGAGKTEAGVLRALRLKFETRKLLSSKR